MTGDVIASTELLCRIAEFRDCAWDAAVLRRTELCLIDSLSCCSAGLGLSQFEPSRVAARNLLGQDSAFTSAYLYAQAANALDYDDTLIGHPGAPIVGAVLAVASRDRLSIDQLLRGIAAGYEAHWILAAGAAPTERRATQVRSVGVWDTVAAGIGVGVGLGLDDSMLQQVIGVAVSHSLLPYTAKWYERPVPAVKNNLGWVAAGAVMSTELAVAGQTGVTGPLDGESGMWRMAGSDRWSPAPDPQRKPAVLRTGFKHFPACWHLQEYLRTFSQLLISMPPGDEVVEITVSGGGEVEKFCQPGIAGPADIAFSLPATFSLLISRIEPGPHWDSFGDDSEMLRYRNIFRYERSEHRAVAVRTRTGAVLSAEVDTSDRFDPAGWGLDEHGVLAKHQRWCAPEVSAALATVLPVAKPWEAQRIPDRFYAAINRMLAICN